MENYPPPLNSTVIFIFNNLFHSDSYYFKSAHLWTDEELRLFGPSSHLLLVLTQGSAKIQGLYWSYIGTGKYSPIMYLLINWYVLKQLFWKNIIGKPKKTCRNASQVFILVQNVCLRKRCSHRDTKKRKILKWIYRGLLWLSIVEWPFWFVRVNIHVHVLDKKYPDNVFLFIN